MTYSIDKLTALFYCD